MPSIQLQKIAKEKIWKFFGGIKPAERKDTSGCEIEDLPLPSVICIPVERHLGKEGEILVNVGDEVKKGQPLTRSSGRLVPEHASTSGTISAISKETLPHPSGYSGLCISIKPDGKDSAVDAEPMDNWEFKKPQELLERLHTYGVEGMGGAQFQTDFKLRSALDDSVTGCNVLIINGCECEPMITCDDRLMREKAEDLALGIRVLKRILSPKITVVAIEDNKPQAIESMKKACDGVADIRVIPTLYPSGAARNLIKIITGIEIPYSEHTSECGIVVNNIGTVYSVKEAIIDGVPVTSRVVTIAGKSFNHPANARVRLGTSVRFLLNHFGLNPEYHQRIILGGPMMGFTLPSIDVPITKSASCVIAPTTDEIPRQREPSNCIRCGRCARVCPSRLVPYQLYSQSKAHNHGACIKGGIEDCTLCGSCAFVCPSFIPLTSQFRYEQAVEAHILEAEKRNIRAKKRMEEKAERLNQEALERQAKKEAALARIKAQKEAEASMTPEEIAQMRKKAIEEARAKAMEKKQELLNKKIADPKKTLEAKEVERLKEEKRKAIAIVRHEGFVGNSGKIIAAGLDGQIAGAQLNQPEDALPRSLKRQAGYRDDLLVIRPFPDIVPPSPPPALIGLEPDDSLQNPEQKKVVASVLLSAEEKSEKKSVLPAAFKKKTLKSKR